MKTINGGSPMKKLIALSLALVMLAATLAGCGTTLEKDADGNLDRGAVINMYLTTEVLNFDPQIAINDDAMLKIFSLLYEGLTTLNSKGDWEKALMDSYEVNEDDRDGYSVLIELKDSKWTDGRTVQANDFVFSWKRLINSNSKSEASTLLYDIKNARQINLGNVSVDDLGVSAVDTYTLKITFENENVDLDRFFTNLSSIALVPLREDVVTRYMYPEDLPEAPETTKKPVGVTTAPETTAAEETTIGEPSEYVPVEYGDYWARRANAIVTNGPFTVKVNNEEGELRLERSSYYYRDTEKNEYLDKYVIPYRLVTNYATGDAMAQLEAYNSEGIFYVGDLPLSERKNYADDAEVSDMMVTHSYFFNTNNPIFADAKVRRALSLALDRAHVADLLTFASPAVGVVPEGAFNTTYKTDFREEGEDLIASTADEAAAKALLKEVKLSDKSFTITVRDNEADKAVAEYAKEQWEKLGFDVKIKSLKNDHVTYLDRSTDTEFEYVIDSFQEAYVSGDFDVIAVDMNMYSPDPFNALAQFAGDFSGNGIDMMSEDYKTNLHVTGFESAAYTELIEKAYAAVDEDERADLLHQAEKLLVEEMPICPVVTLQSAYIASDILSGIKTTYYGTTDFRRMKMKNYMDYKEEETETVSEPTSDEE